MKYKNTDLEKAKKRFAGLLDFLKGGGNINGEIIRQYNGVQLLFPDESSANERRRAGGLI